MRTSYIFITGPVLLISLVLLSVPSANARITKKSSKNTNLTAVTSGNIRSSKASKATRIKVGEKVGESQIRKILEETARYAINFNPGPSSGPSAGNSTSQMATAVVEMMNQIRDPFKHSVTAALISGLYIAALISLTIFAATGTVAFICSFSDCRHFFLGLKADGSSPRPYSGGGGGPFLFKRRENNQYHWVEDMQPVVQSLHESYDKYGHKE